MTQDLQSFPLYTVFALQLLCFGALITAFAARAKRRAISRHVDDLVSNQVLKDRSKRATRSNDDEGVLDSAISQEEIATLRWLLIRNGFAPVKAHRILILARVACVIAVAVLGILLFLLLGSVRTDLAELELVGLLFAPLGWYAPTFLLKRFAGVRHREVTGALPDVLELALICIDSGMGLEAALRRVQSEIAKSKAGMADELSKTINDIAVIGDLQSALKRLADRIPTKEMRTVSSIFSQSLQYGSPLSVTFKTVIDVTRKSQMLMLEERASKFPALVMLPGLVFMFPNFLLIMMGPAVLNLIKGLALAR